MAPAGLTERFEWGKGRDGYVCGSSRRTGLRYRSTCSESLPNEGYGIVSGSFPHFSPRFTRSGSGLRSAVTAAFSSHAHAKKERRRIVPLRAPRQSIVLLLGAYCTTRLFLYRDTRTNQSHLRSLFKAFFEYFLNLPIRGVGSTQAPYKLCLYRTLKRMNAI